MFKNINTTAKNMFTDQELKLFDVITFGVHNFAYIKDLNDEILNELRTKGSGPVSQHYQKWCEKRIPEGHLMPFNPGTMWMLSSAIMINYKRKWDKYLPKCRVSVCGSDWGLQNANLSFPIDPDPTIKRVVRKVRNSIAHSRFDVRVGPENVLWEEFLAKTIFTFNDKDEFKLEISVIGLSKFCSSLYEILADKMIEHRKLQEQGS